MPRPPIASAGRIALVVNGMRLGVATAFNYSSAGQYQVISGVDQVSPSEIAPTITLVLGQCSFLRIVGDGGMQGRGLMPFPQDLPRQKYVQLCLKDTQTGTTIFQADNCLLFGETGQLVEKQFMRCSFSFVGFGFSNEANVSLGRVV